ncbi:sigma-54 dependent transcriptional regulator [Marivita sp. XM-24bin2]|uniref:sigma-54-dependent transcriptional regulator n=1 Tax=unclassified Marivita TaxID=2632480 RepID=UPI000D79DC70|nr:sigma-54 dependent transcriptional regulator [Marivita sp. XM-24bin2]MCR9109715.1 sigma-54 dependent transcriptional regulator [Paracoccaceae bacterium]PWL35025.1 MAG: sigma-54-dependent Fis family transcriptional regulator [Marivita sp. XM-24bin2]
MPDQFRALIVDDDTEMRQSLAVLLERSGWEVDAVGTGQIALSRLEVASPDVVLSDVRMPGMSGLELLEEMSKRPSPPLVLISAHGDIPMAVDAIQNGAYSFLEKPFEPRRLLTVLRHAAEQHRLSDMTKRMREQLVSLSGLDRVLLGSDLRVTELKTEAVDLALSDAPVLITGETGTGKELVARALHRLGPRRDKEFVALNCASLAPDRVEEQMFGTADSLLGSFRKADGGTLFLDEVASCPVEVQTKLLRAIETGVIHPVGTDGDVQTDVRVVAATNEDLSPLVEAGAFRADFLFRLNTFELRLPRLIDRGDDIVMLYEHFVDQFCETYEISPIEMTPEDVAALLAHQWPGNVRELRHVAERRVLAARRGGGSVAEALRTDELIDDVPATLREAVARFEKTLISQAISNHGGRMDAVAEALGIGRRTLNDKIVKLGLEKSKLLE